jgi:2'-5' RNA ligase
MVDRMGTFKRSDGDIWWAGVKGNPDLSALQRDVSDKMAALGFKFDNKAFNPHITIGRRVISKVTPWSVEQFGELVSGIDLMKSELVNGKLIYTASHTTAATR